MSLELFNETAEQKNARMAWWREARFGMFIHWGLYALPAGVWKGQQMEYIGEWIMSQYRIPVAEYEQLAKAFNPVKFNADDWVRLARDAGMKYLIITAKHHDGFAMYHSKVDPYNIVDATPFKRDPLAELSAACGKYGVRFCFYYSQDLDWHEKDAGGGEKKELNLGMSWGNNWDFPNQAEKNLQRYLDKKVKPQLTELLTQYGPVGSIWFDCPMSINRKQCEELYSLVRKLQPDCIMNSRLGNGLGDLDSQGDNEIPGQVITHDWESPMTLNDTWGYKLHDHNWKSPATLVKTLCEIAAKGGNYLLNVGPTAEGLIPQPSVDRLNEVGRWMKTNSDSIYATTAGPISFEGGCCTAKNKKLYLHIFNAPKNNQLTIPLPPPPVSSFSFTFANTKPARLYALADPTASIAFTQTNNAVTFTIPSTAGFSEGLPVVYVLT